MRRLAAAAPAGLLRTVDNLLYLIEVNRQVAAVALALFCAAGVRQDSVGPRLYARDRLAGLFQRQLVGMKLLGACAEATRVRPDACALADLSFISVRCRTTSGGAVTLNRAGFAGGRWM